MSKYAEWQTEEGLAKVTKLATEYENEELLASDGIGIAKSTYYDWKNKYPNFSDAVKKGRLRAGQEVTAALHKKTLPQKKVTIYQELDKEGKVLKQTRKIEETPPDSTVLIWLDKTINKKSERQNLQLSGDADNPINTESTVVILPSNGYELPEEKQK